MRKFYLFNILAISLLVSCSNETFEQNSTSIVDNRMINANIVDGLMHFDNENVFKTSIEYMKSLENSDIQSIMYNYYNEGFEPLFPFYYEHDTELIRAFAEKKRLRMTPNQHLRSNDDPDDDIEIDDDLIADDFFAALLNFDREIVIDNDLYKYTNNGVFKVKLEDKAVLDTYIVDNNITELNFPDPNTIEKGLVQVAPKIIRYSYDRMAYDDPCEDLDLGFGDGMLGGCIIYGGGGGTTGTSPSPNYTESMKDYMKNLTPCDSQSGGVFGWNPFGESRVCYSHHSSDYRAKTKYWNEDLLFYTSIGVKVKHQKKGWLGIWASKDTDEVALVINQALFSITPSNQIAPFGSMPTASSNNQRLYYFDGKFYDNFSASYLVATGVTPGDNSLIPQTPFSEDIIVQEFIDLPILRDLDSIEIEAKEINKLFWDGGVWDGVKSLMNRFNQTPRRITYLVTTPQKAYVNYVDITNRRLNTKKIVDVLDYDWGGVISYKWGIDSNGNWTSNVLEWEDPLTYYKAFSFTELTDFDTISMDFVGMTRKGESWRGSRIVYKKE